jgi:dTDP-D-glucose 4,6-dehydratase
MDGSRLAGLGWTPKISFSDGLARTVDWFRANESWWRAARDGDWATYSETQYGQRLADAVPAMQPGPPTREPA